MAAVHILFILLLPGHLYERNHEVDIDDRRESTAVRTRIMLAGDPSEMRCGGVWWRDKGAVTMTDGWMRSRSCGDDGDGAGGVEGWGWKKGMEKGMKRGAMKKDEGRK